MSIVIAIYIVAARRTPFGTFGGKLKDYTAIQLQEFANRAVFKQIKLSPDAIDSTIIGNVSQTSTYAIFLARHAALLAGVPIHVPALTINRLCGSGFQSIINSGQEIELGDSNIVLCGGTESMSQAPYAVRNVRFGIKLGMNLKLEDTLWEGLTDGHVKTSMAMTAENLAKKYNITRQEADEYALQSQKRWKQANEQDEIFDIDEHSRPQSTIEQLSKLPSLFIKDIGTVTAGNASGICDGAAAIIISNEDGLKKYHLKPLARLVAYHISGVEPTIMAFASQYLACKKVLKLSNEKSNVNGGAIALGHPLGASGTRIIANLVYELRRRQGKYAIGAACIGGGQGIALLIERV